jgi:hypothetical protein
MRKNLLQIALIAEFAGLFACSGSGSESGSSTSQSTDAGATTTANASSNQSVTQTDTLASAPGSSAPATVVTSVASAPAVGSASPSQVITSSGNGTSAVAATSASSSSPTVAGPRTIVSIQVAGSAIKVFDKATQGQGANNFPDAQITAWKEADNTVDLLIPNFDSWRMRGADLEHLSIDPQEIYSSTNRASQITEDAHNYHHWMMGPYSQDGKTFYSLTHTEWYACLLASNCNSPVVGGVNAEDNGWANTLNSLISTDSGTSWQLNSVKGNYTVADAAETWTGSVALSDQIYLRALNNSGLFNPSRVVKQGAYYYSVCTYLHRDFSATNSTAGVYQAPVDKYGLTIIRTADITNPNGWQAWTGGGNYEPVANNEFAVFDPQMAGQSLNAASPQIIYDTNAQAFILTFTLFAPGSAVYYIMSPSLANPIWSQAQAIAGTATLISDPAGPVVGFYSLNYPSTLDDASSGYNYEFTSGSPQLFYSTHPPTYGGQNTARNIYRVPLTISYR